MDEYTLKHLDYIQDTITRMNTNSFQIKGMSVTITAAILALYASSKTNSLFLLVPIIPTLVFWFLDAYYLQQERKFRGIYNTVAGLSSGATDNKVRPFEMSIQNYKGGKYHYVSVLMSKTVWPIYLIPLIMLTLSYIFLLHNK